MQVVKSAPLAVCNNEDTNNIHSRHPLLLEFSASAFFGLTLPDQIKDEPLIIVMWL